MNAFNLALARAAHGLTWHYPCLIWLADYIRDETGNDTAEKWRGVEWDESTAMKEMRAIAETGTGETEVERAIDAFARDAGWEPSDHQMQGRVMIGCYTSNILLGVAAVFDGERRWLIAGEGRARITSVQPHRMWVVA